MERQYKLLIVDDDTEFLNLYSRFFSDRNFIVDTAKDGEEGLAKVRDHDFDVAIIDIQLSKKDGLELARHIQLEGIDTSVIIVTGYGSREEAIKAVNYGVEAWFDKANVNMNELVDKTRQLAQVIPPAEMRRILSVIPD